MSEGEGLDTGARARASWTARGVAPVAALVLALGGCTLLFANNLDEAGGAGPSPEGGSPAREAGVVATTDAGGDGGAPPDAAAPRGCASFVPAPRFCRDFDDGLPIDRTTWSKVETQAGTSTVDTLLPFSPPGAAKVTVSTTSSCRYSRFVKNLDDLTGKSVTVAFRLRAASPWRPIHAPFVLETHAAGETYCAGLLYVRATDGVIDATSFNMQSNTKPNNDVELDGFPPNDTWTEMRFAVTAREGGGLRYVITQRPEGGPETTSTREFPECAPWTAVSAYFGFHCASADGTAYYDDVRIDAE